MSDAEALAVHVRWHARTATVTVQGELDWATAPPLRVRLAEVVARRPRRIVLDLADLAFMDCAGVRAIIGARRSMPADRPLVLRSPTPPVRKVIRITGLDQVCVIQSQPAGLAPGTRALIRRARRFRPDLCPPLRYGRLASRPGRLCGQRVRLALASPAWARSRKHNR